MVCSSTRHSLNKQHSSCFPVSNARIKAQPRPSQHLCALSSPLSTRDTRHNDMFTNPLIEMMFNHAITKVSGVRVLPVDTGFTVPFHKDGEKYKFFCYIPVGGTRLKMYVHAPMIKLPATFPPDTAARLEIGGHKIMARCVNRSTVKKDGSGINTKIPMTPTVEFQSVNPTDTQVFHDFCILLTYFTSRGTEQWGAGFVDGRPPIAELDLTDIGDDINATESDSDEA